MSCPMLEPAACSAPDKLRFLDLWSEKVKCWLCTEVSEELSKSAVKIIKELASLNIGFTLDRGMQITEEWLNSCLPLYLLAMLSTTRAARLQPWALYRLALNTLWSCRYDEQEFFSAFGVTPGQLSYLFGLIGQPYDPTPQILELQMLERGGADVPSKKAPGHLAWSAPLVIDVGMGLGADSRYYLRQGFRVVGIEANPVALDTALADPGTQPYLLSGQLTLLNAAISPANGTEASMPFWVIPHRPEQSKAVSWVALDGGEEVSVRTVRCADLLRLYGEVIYMKVDVEFNTIDCLSSLAREAEIRRAADAGFGARAASEGFWRPPKYISVEVEATGLIGDFYKHLVSLGYDSYKVCRQYIFSPGPCEQGHYNTEILGCGSGPFGEAAVDYKVGTVWRPIRELPDDVEFLREFEDGLDWFDLHAKLPD